MIPLFGFLFALCLSVHEACSQNLAYRMELVFWCLTFGDEISQLKWGLNMGLGFFFFFLPRKNTVQKEEVQVAKLR